MRKNKFSASHVVLFAMAFPLCLSCSSTSKTNASAAGGAGGGNAGLGGRLGGNGGVTVADAGTADAPQAPAIGADRPALRDFSPALLQQLRVKPGFRVAVFATNVMDARMLALGPEGSVYVTTPMSSQVIRLRDVNGDGDVDDAGERTVVASATDTPSLENVHGIFFNQGRVYLASTKSVVSGTVGDDGSFSGLTTLVSDLPDGGQHPYRTLALGPDGKLYVSVGSDCNACKESNSENATMLRLNLDGTPASDNPPNPQHPMLAQNPLSKISTRIWASGLRNTIGFDWHPITHELWGIDQGSDGLGEETPPEEFNRLAGGNSYGWPFCWGQREVDPVADPPSERMSKETYCPGSTPSVGTGFPAHSSPIAFLFYQGSQYPAEYQNDGFVVLRGSWGRLVPDGYKVVRLHFQDGVPATLAGSAVPYEDFLAGFLLENGTAHFGRLAGLTIDASGAVLVSDDTNGMIYRISYGVASDGGLAE
jgi:glucose/arabinose dehydrogenase